VADLAGPPASRHQRARGGVAIAWRRRADGRTVLADLRQEGSLKARFPRAAAEAGEAILLNSSGGVAAGDVLETRLDLGPHASATITTQAAERFYRALPGEAPAHVTATIILADGADLAWLPQESILFHGCAMRRRLTVQMCGCARFLGIEALTFGRRARGEDVAQGAISDTIRILRDGVLLWHDATRLHGAVAAMLDRPAVAAGGRAVATLVHVAPDAHAQLDAVRAALTLEGLEAGASAWNGMLVARLVATDAAAIRAGLVGAAGLLAGARAWPRAWNT
jgi:urease accessory protein